MGALSDPKLERFAQGLLTGLAQGFARGRAATEAAKAAGYGGTSLAHNARKRAARADVKARMAELAAPSQEASERAVVATLDQATRKLSEIAAPDLGNDALKVADQIAALKLLAQIKGWLAPEKRDLTLRASQQMTDDELAVIAGGGRPSAPSAPEHPQKL